MDVKQGISRARASAGLAGAIYGAWRGPHESITVAGQPSILGNVLLYMVGAAKKEFIASSSLSLLVRSPEPFQP